MVAVMREFFFLLFRFLSILFTPFCSLILSANAFLSLDGVFCGLTRVICASKNRVYVVALQVNLG
jgi:hypothetical protein